MLGDRLKQARKAKNLTQKQLADLIDVKHNSISDWENNLHNPNVDQIKQLSKALDVEITWFYSDDELKLLSDSTSNDYLTWNGKQLPKKAKEELDNFIEYLKIKYKEDENK